MNLPTILDQHLEDPCPDCERPFLWCECALPGHFNLTPPLYEEAVTLAVERWMLEVPASPPTRAVALRLWAAYRRAGLR